MRTWVWTGVLIAGLGCQSSAEITDSGHTDQDSGSAGAGGGGGGSTGDGASAASGGAGSTGASGGGAASGGGGAASGGGGAASGGGGGGGEIVCDDGQVACDGACVDVLSDPASCGACGVACAADQGCDQGTCAPIVCVPGEQQECYSGPDGTPVGACHAGSRTCAAGGFEYGPCVGEVVPGPEKCADLVDDDCDGAVNNGCVYGGCSELPAGAPSGIYTIDPDGAGGGTPFSAYCEMGVAGGGWTLIASVADNTYFKDTNCYVDGNGVVLPCDETPFSSAAAHGDIDHRLTSDFKSNAYSTVAFKELLFQDSNGHYASYIVSAVPIKSVFDWFPVGLKNYVGPGVKVHPTYSFPVNETDMNPQFNACATLQLSFNVEDSDTPVGAPNHGTAKGPVWSNKNNNDCYWDDAGIPWTVGAFSGANTTTYRLWLVR